MFPLSLEKTVWVYPVEGEYPVVKLLVTPTTTHAGMLREGNQFMS
jgi:hypothetical protein